MVQFAASSVAKNGVGAMMGWVHHFVLLPEMSWSRLQTVQRRRWSLLLFIRLHLSAACKMATAYRKWLLKTPSRRVVTRASEGG